VGFSRAAKVAKARRPQSRLLQQRAAPAPSGAASAATRC